MHRRVIVWAYMYFFVPNALGCIGERLFRQITGKRVGGWWGRIWMWSVVLYFSQAWVEEDLASGWAGSMRGGIKPEQSIVVWAMSALGLGPLAGEFKEICGAGPDSWMGRKA
jgi:hypothetical protein